MFNILMYAGLGFIVSGTLGFIKFFSTNGQENDIKALPEPSKIIDVEYTEEPIIFQNTKDDPELEKKYADSIINNSILQEKLKQYEDEDKKIKDEVKNTLKGQGKYIKLAEEILKDNK